MSVPLPSPGGGFTYQFDSSLGVFQRTTQSFGPILADRAETQVVYETPHRILDALGDAIDVLGDRRAALAWNVSKPGERFLRGRLSEIRAELESWEYVHGEMTLVVGGRPAGEARAAGVARLDEAIDALLEAGVKPRVARDALAAATGLPRREVYERILGRRGG